MLYAYSFYKHDSYTEGGGRVTSFSTYNVSLYIMRRGVERILPSVRVKSLLPTDSRQSVAVLPTLGTAFPARTAEKFRDWKNRFSRTFIFCWQEGDFS